MNQAAYTISFNDSTPSITVTGWMTVLAMFGALCPPGGWWGHDSRDTRDVSDAGPWRVVGADGKTIAAGRVRREA